MNSLRSLGLDVGDKRIGMALSDPGGILASPMTIIHRTDLKEVLKTIVDIVQKNQVGQIIVGLPLAMDGSISRQAEKVTAFAEDLQNQTSVPVDFRDERLSTVSAKRMMQGIRKVDRTKHDAIAAAVILQTYLDETYQIEQP
ncbi:Holliday junction resolvase RuvX [Chloroflexota bacterium]